MRSMSSRGNQHRRDPAPSRWSYRYERWMLTPAYRRLFRVGPPVVLAACAVAFVALDEGRRTYVTDHVNEWVDAFQHRPEFMVAELTVEGASDRLATEIVAALPIEFPISSFDMDLPAMRTTVEQIAGVEKAILRVTSAGALEVDVTPRVPVAIWRLDDGLRMIDGEGNFVASVQARSERPELPLIAGDGAKEAINEAMALFAAAAPIKDKVRGLVRMGERRWDVVLDGDQRIMLPERNAVTALERVIVMAQTQDLLRRDVQVVDMRNDDRPTLKLGITGTEEMRRLNAALSGAGK
ncbi:cell division protein FtsQ/DivIB [Marivivens donghaensis]|nr:cell division protein FtsQ/DivIB [Marivivens donghaensis]